MKGMIINRVIKHNSTMVYIKGEDGEEYFCHHKNMVKNAKHYKEGQMVTFDVADKGGKLKDAINCDVDIEVIIPTNSMRAKWIDVSDGRVRCNGCGCASDQGKTDYCPHCGAVMRDDLPDNTSEIQRRNVHLTPLNSWKFVKITAHLNGDISSCEYSCSHCNGISTYEAAFCPHCGSYMVDKRR